MSSQVPRKNIKPLLSSSSEFIDVIIPTFNRSLNLYHCLESLAKQTCPSFRIIVLNNSSTDDTAQVCEYFQIKYFGDRLTLKNNNFNIGADPNISRAFEIGFSPWILVIGDSKPLKNSAIETIFVSVNENTDVGFINFYYPDRLHCERKSGRYLISSKNFLANVDSFGNLLLLGNTVYKRRSVLQVLHHTNYWACTSASQFLICYYISFKYNCFLSSEQIIDSMLDKRKYDCLPIIDAWVGFSRCPDFLLTFKDGLRFRSLVCRSFVSLSSILFITYSIAKESINSPSYRFYLLKYWLSVGKLILPFRPFHFSLLTFLVGGLFLIPFPSFFLKKVLNVYLNYKRNA